MRYAYPEVMLRRLAHVAAASLLATAGLLGPAGPSSGSATPDPAEARGLLAAMARDLGLDAAQAHRHLTAATVTARAEAVLRPALDDRFGGAWVDPAGHPVAAVTDPADLATARATGARARLVRYTEVELTATAARLDRAARTAPETVTGWYADLTTNRVVVTALPGTATAAHDFATAAGAAPAVVKVVTEYERPAPRANVHGGDPFRTSLGIRCSASFTVVGGFLTARHCVGRVGEPVYTLGGQRMGQVAAIGPVTSDYAFVRLDPGWTPVGKIRVGASLIPVAGATSAPVGAAVCRFGNTTGWHCGTVLAKNVTVYYADGVIYGLTRTNVCSEPGDSGGPFMAGYQAQGTTSGGSGNCSVGGVTFFQPVTVPLSALGLTLLTSPTAG
ncbi:S1 family peptidase [Phytohabitans kaempferiae]|uniref:S1 family peptidase n=1 Tax=Phytohabitans kaempferiae TaxID=1620943 RepID=A0ABV6M9Y7_9ACTN